MIINIIIGLIFLILFSYLDIFSKKQGGKIPSIFTNTFLLVAFLGALPGSINAAGLGIIIAIFLKDLKIFNTWSDFKIYVGVSMLINALIPVLIFGFFTYALMYLYKQFMGYLSRKPLYKPWIPIFLIAFLVEMFALVI